MTNPSKELDLLIEKLSKEGNVPSLLLHSCCAPCSTYCIEYLSEYFNITIFYYNPNIYPDEEYYFRKEEQKAFIEKFPTKNKISFVETDYETDCFYEAVIGLENEPEKGARCTECFKLRLGKTAEYAANNNFDYFATTLTISPQKNANQVNLQGALAGEKYGVKYLETDFKKKNGYLRSTQITKEYGMYRQDYCGCEYSKRDKT